MDTPPVVPEGFDIASLQGDAWQGIITANETLKESPVALNTKSPIDALEQLINANTLMGKDRLPTPQDDWTEEQWSAHHTALGRPENAEDYKLEEVPEIPGFELNDEFMKSTKVALHAAGLNGKQYEATMGTFFNWLKGATEAQNNAQIATNEQVTTALKAEHGEAYEGLVQEANGVIAQFGSAEFAKQLEESGQGSDPGFVNMMINIAKEFGDDSAAGKSLKNNLSAENGAIKEIADLKADETFTNKLMNESAPGHKDAVAKWHDLHKKAYPGAITK